MGEEHSDNCAVAWVAVAGASTVEDWCMALDAYHAAEESTLTIIALAHSDRPSLEAHLLFFCLCGFRSSSC